MRKMLMVVALAAAFPFQAHAQTRAPAPGGGYSLLGGEVLGRGVNVVSGEFGWPGISFGYTHGMGQNMDIGGKFDLLFGVEGIPSASHFGIGFRVPIRLTALRSDRMSVLLHFDPGIKLFTTDPTLFGISFPVGVVLGYAATREVNVSFGVDLPMTLYVTPSPVNFLIGPWFGPAVEYHVDPKILVGLNSRFGPIFATGGGNDFGFQMQLLLAYRMQ
jgi:hypothetical protein